MSIGSALSLVYKGHLHLMYSVLQVSPRISSQRMGGFDKLPVELIADILGELDLGSLIVVSYLSKRLLAIASEPSLNPWRTPIRRNLHATEDTSYDPHLKNLSVRRSVPRQNWVEILSIAKAHWLLYEATIPNLKATEWEECFKRRFLPGWQKWKKEGSWKEVFMKYVCVLDLDPRIGFLTFCFTWRLGCCTVLNTERIRRARLMKLGQSKSRCCGERGLSHVVVDMLSSTEMVQQTNLKPLLVLSTRCKYSMSISKSQIQELSKKMRLSH